MILLACQLQQGGGTHNCKLHATNKARLAQVARDALSTGHHGQLLERRGADAQHQQLQE